MSKAEYWQRGEAIDFVNDTEETIEANEIVAFGSRVGIAGTVIEPGETGSLHVFGVFEMPKGDGEIETGADVAYDADAGTVSAAGEGATAIGYATEAAAADDETVKVKLLG